MPMQGARSSVPEEPTMRRLLASLAAACLAAPHAIADTLELVDGRVLQGHFRGGSAEMLHFEIDGVLRAVPVTDVVSVRFPGAETLAAAKPAAQAAPTAPTPAIARVPAGTRLRVRLLEAIDPRRHTAGDRISGLLELELQQGGRSVVPSQSRVSGRISQIGSGPGGVSLELTELQIGAAMKPIVTGTQQQFAAAGGDVPAAPDTTPGLPAGTLLEFRLLQPFDVQLAKP
jgi:hypothetical protein